MVTVMSYSLCLLMANGADDNQTLRIGYLLAGSNPYGAGAINLAIEQATLDGLLPGFNFRYVNSRCDSNVRLSVAMVSCDETIEHKQKSL